jgi:hypothetical protein
MVVTWLLLIVDMQQGMEDMRKQKEEADGIANRYKEKFGEIDSSTEST